MDRRSGEHDVNHRQPIAGKCRASCSHPLLVPARRTTACGGQVCSSPTADVARLSRNGTSEHLRMTLFSATALVLMHYRLKARIFLAGLRDAADGLVAPVSCSRRIGCGSVGRRAAGAPPANSRKKSYWSDCRSCSTPKSHATGTVAVGEAKPHFGGKKKGRGSGEGLNLEHFPIMLHNRSF
jgi:hypothetical protein